MLLFRRLPNRSTAEEGAIEEEAKNKEKLLEEKQGRDILIPTHEAEEEVENMMMINQYLYISFCSLFCCCCDATQGER